MIKWNKNLNCKNFETYAENVVNAKSSMSARQSRPFRKDGALLDITGKVQPQMMLIIQQHLNYITSKNTKHRKKI